MKKTVIHGNLIDQINYQNLIYNQANSVVSDRINSKKELKRESTKQLTKAKKGNRRYLIF